MKILWAVKDMNTGKRVGVLKAVIHSDTVYATAKHIFGRNVFIEAPKGDFHKNCDISKLTAREAAICENNRSTDFDSEPWRRQNLSYMCQHHDDGHFSYIPATYRPYPEEDIEHGGKVLYDF